MTNGTGRHRVHRGRSGTLVETYRCPRTRLPWWSNTRARRLVLAATAAVGAATPLLYAAVTSVPLT